jgi:hypothetical protein
MRVSSFVKFFSLPNDDETFDGRWEMLELEKTGTTRPSRDSHDTRTYTKHTQVGSNRNVGKMKSQRKSLLAATILLQSCVLLASVGFFLFCGSSRPYVLP